jgi:hypothetical protein
LPDFFSFCQFTVESDSSDSESSSSDSASSSTNDADKFVPSKPVKTEKRQALYKSPAQKSVETKVEQTTPAQDGKVSLFFPFVCGAAGCSRGLCVEETIVLSMSENFKPQNRRNVQLQTAEKVRFAGSSYEDLLHAPIELSEGETTETDVDEKKVVAAPQNDTQGMISADATEILLIDPHDVISAHFFPRNLFPFDSDLV